MPDGPLTELGRALDNGQFGLMRDQLGILLRNADRLADDAMFLAKDGRMQTARSVAVLAYEEIGKLIIMGWSHSGREVPAFSRRGDHLQKQLAASAVVLAAWFRDRAEEAITQKAVRKEVAAVVEALQGTYEDSLAFRVLSMAFEGHLDRQKQAGFYLDFDELGVPLHDPAKGPEVVTITQQTRAAVAALQDPRMLEAAHKVAAVLPARRGNTQGRRTAQP